MCLGVTASTNPLNTGLWLNGLSVDIPAETSPHSILLVLFCMGKSGVYFAHSGEGPSTAERVKIVYSGILSGNREVTKKFRYRSFKIYIRLTYKIRFGPIGQKSAEYLV